MVVRKSFLAFAAIFLVAGSFLSALSLAKAQNTGEFTSVDRFLIPETNGVIMFAVNGSYDSANLENGAWTFVNLRLNYSGGGVNITVSVKDCIINITNCRLTNTTSLTATLRYVISGQGTQIFRFNHAMKGAYWMVTYNGFNYLVRHRDWESKLEGTIEITGAPANSNVSLSYRVNPGYLGGSGDTSNQSFFEQHSVIIAIGVTATAVVTLALAARLVILGRRRKAKDSDMLPKIR